VPTDTVAAAIRLTASRPILLRLVLLSMGKLL
jgi:hypothetical protein